MSPPNPKNSNGLSKSTPRVGRLGKGLSALIGAAPERSTFVNSEHRQPGVPQKISVSQIRPNARNPRRTFAREELQKLADSISKRGIIQPIMVRAVSHGNYEIIAGERRWRAAKLAGLAEIPVWIRKIDDAGSLEIALIENIQREDLNPIDEATGYRDLIEQFGYSQRVVAETLGRSKSHIANTVRLLQLPDEVKKQVVSGQLSAGHARALLTLPDPAAAAAKIIERGMSVRQTEAFAKDLQIDEQSADAIPVRSHLRAKVGSSVDDVAEQQLVSALATRLGVPLSISKQGEKRILRMELASRDDLLGLCRRFRIETETEHLAKQAS